MNSSIIHKCLRGFAPRSKNHQIQPSRPDRNTIANTPDSIITASTSLAPTPSRARWRLAFGPRLDRPQDAHDRVIGSTADRRNSSPTSHGATTGSPSASEPSALVTVIGGDAYATGTNTDATGAVNNSVKDLGYATVASGFAVFEASGTSSHGDAAAGADTFLSVAGADIVMEFELDLNFHIGNKDVAVSKLVYYAINIDNWTPPNGPIVMDFQTHASGQFGGHNGYLPSNVAPSGILHPSPP